MNSEGTVKVQWLSLPFQSKRIPQMDQNYMLSLFFFPKNGSLSFTTSSPYSAIIAQYAEQMQKKTV